MSVVAGLARSLGENEDEWRRKWAKVHVDLEQEGKTKLLPPRHKPEPGERAVLLAARLAALDRALPDGEPKTGADNHVEAWVDLTDYLRRLVLIFNPKSLSPALDGRRVVVTRILPHLDELAGRTDVQEWKVLANRIRTTYKEASRRGAVTTPDGNGSYYVDEFAKFRAEAARQAARLAQDSAHALADTALSAPSPDLHQYDHQGWVGFAVSGLCSIAAGVLLFVVVGAQERTFTAASSSWSSF